MENNATDDAKIPPAVLKPSSKSMPGEFVT